MQVIKFYEDLHNLAELGFCEFKTSAYLKEKLSKAGFYIQEVGQTGFYAQLTNSDYVVALRADMDALGHNIDDKICAIHSCGHDAHSAMLLNAALIAKQNNLIKNKSFRFLFQPAEELGKGALFMIENKALDDVNEIYGMHIRPKQECQSNQAIASMYFAASCAIKFDITGLSAHAARPHLGINAIDSACALINAARMIYVDTSIASSIKVTRFVANNAVTNSINDKASIVFDLRAQDNKTMQELKEKLLQAAKVITFNNSTYEYEILNDIVAAQIDSLCAKECYKACVNILGEENVFKEKNILGGEDFFFYPVKKGIKAGFMGLGVDCTPGLHHPNMSINKNALNNGVNIWLELIKNIDLRKD
ncbi:amidohydrolase [Campylobacter canadensis]|uniref:Amidohydrolase n=1 Tax=Campylobacter canadensis TaxID=449520 RepID=A0ABS7WUH4_9BACT|nr:amidohydrolase [Campylobacter canadensis]MBZ7987679.1 amidohydrolase [Campylobacter canadensis]MBZ7998784.1 amidohydrolase [Campylobacter canadensis]